MIPFLKLTPDVRGQKPERFTRADTFVLGFALGVVLMTFVFAAITVLTR